MSESDEERPRAAGPRAREGFRQEGAVDRCQKDPVEVEEGPQILKEAQVQDSYPRSQRYPGRYRLPFRDHRQKREVQSRWQQVLQSVSFVVYDLSCSDRWLEKKYEELLEGKRELI